MMDREKSSPSRGPKSRHGFAKLGAPRVTRCSQIAGEDPTAAVVVIE